jgi:hypothetical protein
LDHLIALIVRQAGVKSRHRDVPFLETLDLILHERDERRDDHRQTREQRRRQLIAQRFPLPGRHHGQHVAPFHDSADHLFLAWPEAGKAETLLELTSEVVHGRRH